jgi:hypothetical protein
MMEKEPSKMKIGSYEAYTRKDDGVIMSVYYSVRIDKHSWVDVDDLFDAEVLSRLVRIEELLKKSQRKRGG